MRASAARAMARRLLAVDGDEGVERRVEPLDAVEEQRRQFDAGDLLLRQRGGRARCSDWR